MRKAFIVTVAALVLAACSNPNAETNTARQEAEAAVAAAEAAIAAVDSPTGASISSGDVVTSETFGSGGYSVETTTRTKPNGDTTIRSSDTMGNSYEVSSRSYTRGNTQVVESSDSMGNSYRVESSCNASGCTSTDSMGNRCTITASGQAIGCGF